MQYRGFLLWKKGCLAAILILFLGIWLSGFSVEAGGDRPVVRVGFPMQQGLTELDEDGNYTGL